MLRHAQGLCISGFNFQLHGLIVGYISLDVYSSQEQILQGLNIGGFNLVLYCTHCTVLHVCHVHD